MTSLEIVRLDSTANGGMHLSPSHKSTLKSRKSSVHSPSPPLPPVEFLQEIPINIIKSPSFTSFNSSPPRLIGTTPILLSIEKVSPLKQQELDKTHVSKDSEESKLSTPPPKLLVEHNDDESGTASSSSIPGTAAMNSKSKLDLSVTQSITSNSSSQLNSSDDIDYVLNTNSASLANELEAKVNIFSYFKWEEALEIEFLLFNF